MGFLTGRVIFLRFRIDGPALDLFGPEQLDKLSAHAIGKQRTESKDGTEVGWIAGDDILDVDFDLAKNVVNDTLHFSLRVDTQKLPADLLRAYARAELQALAAENPSGRPSAKQKKEARETAVRTAGGRRPRTVALSDARRTPFSGTGSTNSLLVGTTSTSVLDHVQKLFQETFGCSLTRLDAGIESRAHTTRSRAGPCPPLPGSSLGAGQRRSPGLRIPASPVYLGNEFLLWLWFVLENEGDTLTLGDGSEVAVMLARTLVLDCPRGLSGNETIRSDSPVKLPEARRAIQAGKLPRQVGMILVRHDQQYELTLQAETLAVNGAKLPSVEDGEERVKLEERVGQMRHLIETLDLLYDSFLQMRLGGDWPRERERMQQWLHWEEPVRLAEPA